MRATARSACWVRRFGRRWNCAIARTHPIGVRSLDVRYTTTRLVTRTSPRNAHPTSREEGSALGDGRDRREVKESREDDRLDVGDLGVDREVLGSLDRPSAAEVRDDPSVLSVAVPVALWLCCHD